MVLKAKLFGRVYEFQSLREVIAKANEEKSGAVSYTHLDVYKRQGPAWGFVREEPAESW